QAMKILEDEPSSVCVRTDWGNPVKIIRPMMLDMQARRNGISRVDVAEALESSFEGRPVGFYREPAHVAVGTYPQEARLLPIIVRPPLNERRDVDMINSLLIWSPIAGRMIPMRQVVSGTEITWEDPLIMRRNRFPTVTVHASPRVGLPSQLFERIRSK